jgi:glycosyltransferase involved in cell wall biosynthesis
VVAHVFYPPQAVGGATRVVADNIRDIRAIAGDRLDIEVFACLDGGNPYQVTSDAHDGIRVTRVGSPQVDALEYRAADERMGAIFGEYLDRTRPALVHFHCIQRLTASIVTAAAARSIPYIVTVHDGWWISEHQFLLDACGQFQAYDMARPIDTLQRQGADAFARATVLRRALVGAHRVLAVSEPFAALYRACGVPNVITVENGVPDLPPATARLPHPHGKVRLGFIGGLARHKGYDLVHIALMARPWRNLAILLIDHALPQGSVRHETWGTVPVEFRPKWPQAEVADLYARIDVLLAPSLWPESYGLVTREAVAAGCYVIASDRGSVADCVQDGISGFVIDVASPDGLIAALARIDADPARFQQPPPPPPPMRTARDQAQDIAALYDTILRDHPPRGATADLNIAARRPISLLGNQGSSATDG